MDVVKLIQNDAKLTDFQKSVLEVTCQIPCGKVTSYNYIANLVKCKSSQAVGQALKRNPYAPHCPCHRVIGSNGNLGGYLGSSISKKIALLQDEGVVIIEGRRVDRHFFWHDFQRISETPTSMPLHLQKTAS